MQVPFSVSCPLVTFLCFVHFQFFSSILYVGVNIDRVIGSCLNFDMIIGLTMHNYIKTVI